MVLLLPCLGESFRSGIAVCAAVCIAPSRPLLPPPHPTRHPPPAVAPPRADLTSLPSIRVNFTLGKPFLPYEQLLAVQPSSRWVGEEGCAGGAGDGQAARPMQHIMALPCSSI